MSNRPEKLAAPISKYHQLTEDLGKPRGSVSVMMPLPLADPAAASQKLAALRDLQVDRVICAIRYDNVDEYRTELDALMSVI